MLKPKKKSEVRPTPDAKPAAKPRKRQKGALAAICFLLVASALIRIGVGATQAFAKSDPAAAHAPEPGHDAPSDHGTEHAASEIPAAVTDADILPLMEALKAREARIKKREEDVDVRMQALALAEQEIDRKLKALEDAEASLRATMTLASTAAEDDLTRLTDVYAKMKPKQAAQLFAQMDPNFAAGFLGRMKPDSAAAILAGMQPDQAYLISVILAGRNAEVPRQ